MDVEIRETLPHVIQSHPSGLPVTMKDLLWKSDSVITNADVQPLFITSHGQFYAARLCMLDAVQQQFTNSHVEKHVQ